MICRLFSLGIKINTPAGRVRAAGSKLARKFLGGVSGTAGAMMGLNDVRDSQTYEPDFRALA